MDSLRIGSESAGIVLGHACPGNARAYGAGDPLETLHRFRVDAAFDEIRASFFLEIGLPKWREWTAQLRATLGSQSGRASLKAAEAAFELDAIPDKRGRLLWTGVIRRPGLMPRATLEFSIRAEHASLQAIVRAAEAIAADMESEPPFDYVHPELPNGVG